MNRHLTGVCKAVVEAAGGPLEMCEGYEELDLLLDSWLSTATSLENLASAANTALGSLPSLWCPDVIPLTFEFFIEVALTEIALYAGTR